MDKRYLRDAAQKALQKGELLKAFELYRELVEAESKDMQVRNTLGDICVRLGKLDDAVKYYTYVAKDIAKKGFYHKAIAIHKKSLRIDPNNTAIYEEMADLYNLLKLYMEAKANYNWLLDRYRADKNTTEEIRIIKKLLKITPDDEVLRETLVSRLSESGSVREAAEENYEHGKRLYDEQKYDEASSLFEEAIKIVPDNVGILYMAADCLNKLERNDEAVAYLESACGYDSENMDVLKLLSRLYYLQERDSEALATIMKIVEKENNNLEYQKLLIRVCMRLGRLKEASVYSQEVLSLLISQQNYDEYFALCEALEKEGILNRGARKKRAEIFEKIEDNKSALDDYLLLSKEYYEEKNYKESLPLAEKALKIDNGSKEAVKQIELIKIELGKIVDREETLFPAESSLRVQEDNKVKNEIFFNLASEIKRDISGINSIKSAPTAKPDDASPSVSDATLSEFKREVESKIESTDTITHFNLGMAYMQMELFEEAIAEFKKAKDDEHYMLDSIKFLAECEFKLGRNDEAIEILLTAIKNHSGEGDKILSLKYTYARFLEEFKMYDKSMAAYIEIYNVNPDYKDIKARMKNLRKSIFSFPST